MHCIVHGVAGTCDIGNAGGVGRSGRHTTRVSATLRVNKGCTVSALLNSFALWGGLSILFSGWIVGYSLHVESRQHGSWRTIRRTRRHASALTIVPGQN